MIQIEDFLMEGRTSGTSLRQLSKLTGLTERDVRRAVLDARCRGVPIISSERGYYLAQDQADIKEFVLRRERSMRTSAAAIADMKKKLKGENKNVD